MARAHLPSQSSESGAMNGVLATDCTERNDPYTRPTHAGLQTRPRGPHSPRNGKRTRGTRAKTAASLTCLLFIRRTSSRKSRDSMVRWRTRQPAAKKKRQNHREEPLPHGPDSQRTGRPDACTSASGAGANEAPPLRCEDRTKKDSRALRTARGPGPATGESPELTFGGREPAEARFPCSARGCS